MTDTPKLPHELGEGKVKLRAIGHNLHRIGLVSLTLSARRFLVSRKTDRGGC